MAATNRYAEVVDLVGSSSGDGDDVVPLPIQRRRPVMIDSDDEDEVEVPNEALLMAGVFPADDAVGEESRAHAATVQEGRVDGGTLFVIDGEEIFIPEELPHPMTSTTPAATTLDNSTWNEPTNDREFTVDDCLQHVLEIFPDISHDHVHSLWAPFDHESDYEVLTGRARLDNIVEQLISSTNYPKQIKGKLKRKREDSVEGTPDMKQWMRADRGVVPGWAKGAIAAVCKADFPTIPRNHISDRLGAHRFLFQTYVALAKDLNDTDEGARIFGRGRASNGTTADADTIALNCGQPELVAELAAARLQVVAQRTEREAAKTKKRAEEENLQKAIASGETAECSACFDDLPMNRQIHCDGETTHFTCFDCAETYIKTEVGDSRCRVLCPAGCGSGFSHSQLHLLENKQLLEKLAQIQQEQDIRDAGLEDLESCPFCDYKAIMPPVEENFEFRCANPDCEKVSCRRCKAISHVPITCEQHAKDNKLSGRHQIEEAMTAALVRSCVKCKKQFIKESGCNKMSCMSCGTLQCYVCSAVVKDYNHFDQGSHRGGTLDGAQGSTKCPLYDNVEERHKREVKEAETKARAEVVENNPDVSAEDLEIKVSEAVKKAENDRIKRAGGGIGGAYYGDFDQVLRHQAAFANNHGARRLFGDAADLDEDDLGDMLGVFGGGQLPGRPWADAAANRHAEARNRWERMRDQRRELQHQLQEQRRARMEYDFGFHARRHEAPAEGGAEEGAPVENPLFRARDLVVGRLQGYIPVVFPPRPRGPGMPPPPIAPRPAQPPAAQRDDFADWPDFFGGFYDRDPFGQPDGQPANGAAQNNAPANANAFAPPFLDQPAAANNARPQPAPNVPLWNAPNMPGAFPGQARPPNALRNVDVLRKQREQIVELRQQAIRQQQQEAREAGEREAQRARERQAALQEQRQRRVERMNRRLAGDYYRPAYH